MGKTARYVVGFDLGDGESSIAYLPIERDAVPKVYTRPSGETGIITAYAETDRVVIGEQALLYGDVERLQLNFKVDPTEDPGQWRMYKKYLGAFVEELYNEFREQHPKIASEAVIFIGRPSGWSKEAVALYSGVLEEGLREILDKVGFEPGLHLVSESRSAFIQVRDSRSLTPEQQASVLIIDIGSSTTDLTFVKNLTDNPQELNVRNSARLGGRLIDRLLLEAVIEQYANPQQLESRFEDKPRDKRYLQYLCRKAKEIHFGGGSFEPKPDTDSFRWIVKECWPILQALDVDVMLSREIPELESDWRTAFENLLSDARSAMDEVPRAIILTGGGSRMSFTREICQRVFPEAHIPDVPDDERSLSVARGLARLGRWRYRVDAFREEVNALVEDEQVRNEIGDVVGRFLSNVYPIVIKAAMATVLREMFLQMRAGELTTRQIKESSGNILNYWLSRVDQWLVTEGKQELKIVQDSLREPIQEVLTRHTRRLAEEYQIPVDSLSPQLEISSFEDFGPIAADWLGTLFHWYARALELIPVPMRKLVPRQLINGAFDAGGFAVKLMGEVIAEISEPGYRDRVQNRFLAQIRDQLNARADDVAKYVH